MNHIVYVTETSTPPADTNDTTRAQHTDEGGIYKNWPRNSPYAWQEAEYRSGIIRGMATLTLNFIND